MPSINTAINLTDRMTGPIQHIISAVNSLITATERAGTSVDGAFDVNAFDDTRRSLDLASREMQEVVAYTEQARNTQENYNRSVNDGISGTNKLLDTVKSLAGAYIGMQGIQKLVNMSDNYVQTRARLNLLVDDGGSVDELESKIRASANRARASYTDTADAIAKMGLNASSAFNSNDELIAFMENVNKQFVIGGASAEAEAGAMMQLTQAMGAGALRGEELNSILDAAPMIARNIENYMGWAEGSIKSYAEQGLVSAEVVKNAMLSSTDEINAQFNSMPMTWGQVWSVMGNYATVALKPVLLGVSALANNMDIVAPIVLGVASAFAVYCGWLAVYKTIQGAANTISAISAARSALKTGATLAEAAATTTATGAQVGLNAALLACPITWIIIAVLALIAALYFVIAIINRGRDEAISATGVIMGVFAIAGAFILNTGIGVLNAIIQALLSIFVYPFLGIIEWVLNAANGGFNSFGDAVANLIGQIIGWFLSLGQVVTRIIDAIFGTNWTSGLEALRNNVISWGKNETAITLTGDSFNGLDRIAYGDAWDSGYNFGTEIDSKVSGIFNGEGLDEFDPSGYLPGTSGGIDPTGGIGDTLNGIAADTSAISDEVATTAENEEYLRKIAERDVIVRYVTPNINVKMNNQNNIRNGMDVDGVIDHMVRKTNEAMANSAEGA